MKRRIALAALASALLGVQTALAAAAFDQSLVEQLDDLCGQARADARGPQRDLFWSNLLQCWQMQARFREDTLARLGEHVDGICRDIASKCSAAPGAVHAARLARYSNALGCPARGQACGAAAGEAALSGQERFRRIRDSDPDAQRYYRSCRQGALDTRAAKDEWLRAVERSARGTARAAAVSEYLAGVGAFITAVLEAEEITGAAIARSVTPFLLFMSHQTANPDSRELELYKIAAGNWRNQCELLVKAVARVDPSLGSGNLPWLEEIRRFAQEALAIR